MKSLYLESFVFYHLLPNSSTDSPEQIPLPLLKVLSLRHIWFNGAPFGGKAGVLAWLRDTLVARRVIGAPITKLIACDAMNFTQDDADSLRLLVTEFLWDQKVYTV